MTAAGPRLRLATRSSAQATAQSEAVAAALRAAGHEVELLPVDTTGDRRLDVPLHVIFRGAVKLLAAQVATAALLILFPQIALWLPSLMH